MRIVLEFDGTDISKFEDALNSDDDNFNLLDSIFWELDYGTGESVHNTKFGKITIKQQA